MKKLIFALLPVLLFSCTKEDNTDETANTFEKILTKYLVCDSVKTTTNGVTTRQVLGKGKGSDIRFGPYGQFTVYSTPEATYNFQYEKPDKIYYWLDTYNANQYYLIQSMTTSKVVLQQTDAGKSIVRFYTVEP